MWGYQDCYGVLLLILGVVGIEEQQFISNFWQLSTVPAVIDID